MGESIDTLRIRDGFCTFPIEEESNPGGYSLINGRELPNTDAGMLEHRLFFPEKCLDSLLFSMRSAESSAAICRRRNSLEGTAGSGAIEVTSDDTSGGRKE